MTVPPTIEVLLATYNGARFLREQIESILSQDYQALCILAADDGSQDDTPAILAEYAERFPKRLRVLGGAAPTGSAKANFLRLMHHASEAYVCFSDQDDVWLPSKVRLSLETMQALEQRHSFDGSNRVRARATGSLPPTRQQRRRSHHSRQFAAGSMAQTHKQ